MENKIIKYDDCIIGGAYYIGEYLLKEYIKTIYKDKYFILGEILPELDMLMNDLKRLYALDTTLVKVSQNPMGGYHIVKLKECD